MRRKLVSLVLALAMVVPAAGVCQAGTYKNGYYWEYDTGLKDEKYEALDKYFGTVKTYWDTYDSDRSCLCQRTTAKWYLTVKTMCGQSEANRFYRYAIQNGIETVETPNGRLTRFNVEKLEAYANELITDYNKEIAASQRLPIPENGENRPIGDSGTSGDSVYNIDSDTDLTYSIGSDTGKIYSISSDSKLVYQVLPDVSLDAWYAVAVYDCYSAQAPAFRIMDVKEDGLWHPYDLVTCCEWLEILNVLCDHSYYDNTFTRVHAGESDMPIMRGELLECLINTAELDVFQRGRTLSPEWEFDRTKSWPDSWYKTGYLGEWSETDIPDWGEEVEAYQTMYSLGGWNTSVRMWRPENVLKAYNWGLTHGIDDKGTCNPRGYVTRAELAQMLYNADMTHDRDIVFPSKDQWERNVGGCKDPWIERWYEEGGR